MAIPRTSMIAIALLLLAATPSVAQVVFEPHPLRLKDGDPDPREVAIPCRREPAAGQKATAQTNQAPPKPTLKDRLDADPLGTLNHAYHEESWQVVQESARYLLDQFRCAAGEDADAKAYDYFTSYIVLNWIGSDAFDTHSVHRLLVSANVVAPFKADLPGLDHHFEVLLSNHKTATLTSVLTSTEEADPLLAQIPDVAARILPGLFGLIADVNGPANAQLNLPAGVIEPPKQIVLFVTAFEVQLPARRAKIDLTAILGEPITQEEFEAEATRVANRTGFQLSSCAHDLAEADRKAVSAAALEPECGPGNKRSACLEVFHTALLKEFNTIRKNAACATDANLKPMTAVDDAFRAFIVGNLGREVKSELTFSNTPPRHYSFGLLEAVALGAWVQETRVKLTDDGILKADPMPRLLTIVTLNRSFEGYDPSTVTPTKQEKWRSFVGGVIAPDFGVATGLSWLPMRGFAVNLGIALLFPKNLAEGNVVNAEPTNTKDPFGLGTAGSLFLGAAYNFK